jgi:DedD protein
VLPRWQTRLRRSFLRRSKRRKAYRRDARRHWPTQTPRIASSCAARSTWWVPQLIGSNQGTYCHRPHFPNILRRPEPLTFKADTSSMDRRVKERLVGASILVALIVLIVPELLSGPPSPGQRSGFSFGRSPAPAPQPVRTVTVDLATSKAPAADPGAPNTASGADSPGPNSPTDETPPAPGSAQPDPQPARPDQAAPRPAPAAPSRSSPAPSHASPASGRVSTRGPPAAVETAPSAPRSVVTAARPAKAGTWAVQLGSFANRVNADKLARQLQGQGFSVHVVSGGSGASTRYRVRIGPLADRAAAAQAKLKLQSLGHSASFVPPAP